MRDSVLRIVFLIGFVVSSVIRAPHTRRPRRDRIADDRVTGLEKLMLFVTSTGMVLVPLLYVLTPWLDFADYQLPVWAGWLGVAVLAVSLWLFWLMYLAAVFIHLRSQKGAARWILSWVLLACFVLRIQTVKPLTQ